MNARRPLKDVFRWPIVIGVISIIGLLSALVGDGVMDAMSWALLSVPIAVALHKWRPTRVEGH